MKQDEMLKKAKGYALRLFKFRPRSKVEFISKMTAKAYTVEVIDEIVREFETLGFIDDQAFARGWLHSRLKKYGLRRVTLELKEKGISKEQVSELWNEARVDYDEETLVSSIAQKRLGSYRNVEPMKRKRRTMEYLIRRGFSIEVVNKVLRKLTVDG